MYRLLAALVLLVLTTLGLSRAPSGESEKEKGARAAAARAGLCREQMFYVALDVKEFLKKQGEDSVALGNFTGSPQLPSGAGAGLTLVLKEELQRVGVRVSRQAKVALSGTFRPVDKAGDGAARAPGPADAGPVPVHGLLKVRAEDSAGKALFEFEQKTYDPGEVAALFGLTFASKPLTDQEFAAVPGLAGRVSAHYVKAAAAVTRSLHGPRVFLKSNSVKADGESPYAVEVLIKGEDGQYRARKPRQEDGLAFVRIKRGEVYAVRLVNNSKSEAAVELTVDGLSSFIFSEGSSRRWIVGPSKKVLVKGWHRNSRDTNEFLITAYAKGAVALLGADPAGVGTITARFHASWKSKAGPPKDEPFDLPVGISQTPVGPTPVDATGQGEKVEVKTRTVDREVGVLRAVVSVRYNK